MTERNAPGCEINITINSSGDVNIYNCTGGETKPEPCAPATPPGGPGACLPLAHSWGSNRSVSNQLISETVISNQANGPVLPQPSPKGWVFQRRHFRVLKRRANSRRFEAFIR